MIIITKDNQIINFANVVQIFVSGWDSDRKENVTANEAMVLVTDGYKETEKGSGVWERETRYQVLANVIGKEQSIILAIVDDRQKALKLKERIKDTYYHENDRICDLS